MSHTDAHTHTADPRIQDIWDFWFGKKDAPEYMTFQRKWYFSTPEFDEEIRTRFGPTIDAALAGELDSWRDTPQGCIALILLCDQFTRNSYRGTAKAFAGDDMAMKTTLHMIDNGMLEGLSDFAVMFALMPFEHTESLELQTRGLEKEWPRLRGSSMYEMLLKYAKDHHDVIARFGRFPHRNAALGRESTPEEVEYLHTAETWGQTSAAKK